MVEQREAVRDVEGMMIWDADHARAELDSLGARRRDRHEYFQRRDYFPSRRMMLADEGFVVAELVERFDQLHFALETERRMLAHAMNGGHDNSELLHLALIGRSGP